MSFLSFTYMILSHFHKKCNWLAAIGFNWPSKL
jgi:hypothetical protein